MGDKYFLAINLSHDSSVCIFKNQELIVAIESERLSHVRHEPLIRVGSDEKSIYKYIPHLAINYCLKFAQINLEQVYKIIIVDCDLEPYKTHGTSWIATSLNVDGEKVHLIGAQDHHLAHANLSFLTSSFDDCLIVVADAYVESYASSKRITESYFAYKDRHILSLDQNVQNRGYLSLGAFYQLFCAILGFNKRLPGLDSYNFWGLGIDQPGKLMGLASYGKQLELKWPEGETSISLDEVYEFLYSYNLVKKVDDVSQLRNLNLTTYQKIICPNELRTDFRDKFSQDIAATAQSCFEAGLLAIIKKGLQKFNVKNICIEGGLALNCRAQGYLKTQLPDYKFHTSFAATDAGTAIGAALIYIQKYFSIEKIPRITAPYWGPDQSLADDQICSIVERHKNDGKEIYLYSGKKEKIDFIAELLANGAVGAILEGRSEFGPRALGHRSIIASPLSDITRDHINFDIKTREWFRPLAPTILHEHTKEYLKPPFDDSPYMTKTAELKSSYQQLSSICSIDYKTRFQSLDNNPSTFRNIITAFGKKTEHYILLNTSANTDGAPIFESVISGFESLIQKPIDFIFIENQLILLNHTVFEKYVAFKNDQLCLQALSELGESLCNLKSYVRAFEVYKKISELSSTVGCELFELSTLIKSKSEQEELFTERIFDSPQKSMIANLWCLFYRTDLFDSNIEHQLDEHMFINKLITYLNIKQHYVEWEKLSNEKKQKLYRWIRLNSPKSKYLDFPILHKLLVTTSEN